LGRSVREGSRRKSLDEGVCERPTGTQVCALGAAQPALGATQAADPRHKALFVGLAQPLLPMGACQICA